MISGEKPACELPSAPDQSNSSGDFATVRFLLLLLLAVFGLSLAWTAPIRSAGVDFYQFWVGGQVLAQAQHPNLYSDDGRASLSAEFLQRARESASPRQRAVAEYRQTLETYSSPLLYSLFRWCSTGHYERDLDNYRLLLIASLVFSVVVFARLLGLSWEIALGAIAILSAWFAPFASELQVGNVNTLQLASLAVYAWVRFRWRWQYRDLVAGAVLALSLAFKPNLIFVPALLAVYWLLHRQFRCLAQHATGGAAGGVLALVIGIAGSRDSHCWTDWLAAVRALPEDIIPVAYGNYALVRLLREAWDVNLAIAVLVLFAGLSILTLWLTRRRAEATPEIGSEMSALALGCLLVVLVPRLAWFHYYVLVIPVILVLLSPVGNLCSCPTRLRLRYVLLGAALFGYAFANLRLTLSPLAQGAVVVGATLILFALMLMRMVEARRSAYAEESFGSVK